MKNLYETVQELCKNRRITIAALERECRLGNATIKKWGTSIPSGDRLSKVADYFEVSVDYLLGKTDYVRCCDCGLLYNPLNKLEMLSHSGEHRKWKEAVGEHGFCWNYNQSFNERFNAEFFLKNQISKEEDNYNHIITLLKADFSDLLREQDYKADIDFNEFCFRKLSTEEYSDLVSKETYKKVLDMYHVSETKSHETHTLSSQVQWDIAKELDTIMKKLTSVSSDSLTYHGEELNPEAVELFRGELEIALKRLKFLNKEKIR